MTGYGKKTIQLPTKKITLEIKSLNSKNLDLNVRIPSYYKEKELEVRKTISTHLRRGKIDFSIYVEMTADERLTSINSALVRNYMQQLQNILQSGVTNDVELLQMAVRMPDALKTEREELDEAEWEIISSGISEVIEKLIDYRTEEGKAMDADFRKSIQTIFNLLEEVKTLDTERLNSIRTRLDKAIEEIKSAIEGMLEPTKEENILGQAEVREVYKISKIGTIAGCYVQEGKILRNSRIRLIRDGIVIFPTKEGQNGEISSLKRFKEDAKEVRQGLECGISIKNFNDIKVGDVIEGYEIVEVKQKLEH